MSVAEDSGETGETGTAPDVASTGVGGADAGAGVGVTVWAAAAAGSV